jgi:purine-nucleoside phosphorylase
MQEYFTLEQINQAVDAIRSRTIISPRVGLILGSGLSSLADMVEKPEVVSYADIPFWRQSTVEGHPGRLVFGWLEKVPVMVLQGRTHFYEGYSMAEVTLPVRVMKCLGVEILMLTNAAGAINPDFEPGDIMLITDHLALVAMMGFNPLRGPNLDTFGPRFPDMSQIYDRALNQLTRGVADQAGLTLREGVYAGLAGPSFESPADLRFLRSVGADAVGMSTVPEAIVARHSGLRTLGLSGISNKANLDGNTLTTHHEVLEAGRIIAPKLSALIRGVLRQV